MAAKSVATFTLANLAITSSSKREKYRRRTGDVKTALHWGQRKLLLSEIEFLTMYWRPQEIPNPILVYVGAAPGTHLELLSKLFPAFTFHLYDPATFKITESERIKIYSQYFTDADVARYANQNNVFFISDIRTADFRELDRAALAGKGIHDFDDNGYPIGPADLIKDALAESKLANENQIWGDMDMQQRWTLSINPAHALLKFRLPYPDNEDKLVPYLKGTIYWQAWEGQTSSETRLKPAKNSAGVYEKGNWSIVEYEEWNFYHNTVEREQTYYRNIFTNDDTAIDFPELLNDFDSVAEATILQLYWRKQGIPETELATKTKQLSRLITMALNKFKGDTTNTASLAGRRAAPTKTSNKYVLDAFRAKKAGKPLPQPTSFGHTYVEINPSWQGSATVAPVLGTKPIPAPAPSPKTTTMPGAVPTMPVPAPSPKVPTMPVPAPSPKVPTMPVPAPSPKIPTMPIPTMPIPAPSPKAPTIPMPAPTIPMPAPSPKAPTMPIPAPTMPMPAPTMPVPAPTMPMPSPTMPIPAPTMPVPAPTMPVPAPTMPVPAPSPKAPTMPAPVTNPVFPTISTTPIKSLFPVSSSGTPMMPPVMPAPTMPAVMPKPAISTFPTPMLPPKPGMITMPPLFPVAGTPPMVVPQMPGTGFMMPPVKK